MVGAPAIRRREMLAKFGPGMTLISLSWRAALLRMLELDDDEYASR
jgi:hypothetical protein